MINKKRKFYITTAIPYVNAPAPKSALIASDYHGSMARKVASGSLYLKINFISRLGTGREVDFFEYDK